MRSSARRRGTDVSEIQDGPVKPSASVRSRGIQALVLDPPSASSSGGKEFTSTKIIVISGATKRVFDYLESARLVPVVSMRLLRFRADALLEIPEALKH